MRVNFKAPEKQKIKQDITLKALSEATPEEIDAWVDENLQNIDDLKAALKKIIRVQVYLLKRQG